jgi:hypothetical protein
MSSVLLARGRGPLALLFRCHVQVKQRIIRLDQLLFGNELTEGDIARDSLHSRVQTLSAEVGTEWAGGPRSTPAELDAQLQLVEKALGLPPQ